MLPTILFRRYTRGPNEGRVSSKKTYAEDTPEVQTKGVYLLNEHLLKIHKDTLERYTEDTQKDTQQTPEDTLERYTLKENKIHRRYTEKIHFIGKNTSRLFPVEKKCDLHLI